MNSRSEHEDFKIGWVYPRNRRCGISFYSRKYIHALEKLVPVVEIDPNDLLSEPEQIARILSSCSLIHVQYEPSFFFSQKKDVYPRIIRSLKRPVVITMHEVYRNPPGVFPRQAITGAPPVRWIKKLRYDIRHPELTALRKHRRFSFGARVILVHFPYQRQILVEQGVDPSRIQVLPYPVSPHNPATSSPTKFLHLGATGFVNPNFDYDLLFDALARISRPWRFTWIGGVRPHTDDQTYRELRNRIAEKGWEEQFLVTGWVSDQKRDELLAELDIYCALFSARSSSESLATALAAQKMVIATPLEFICELNQDRPVVHTVAFDPEAIARDIETLGRDSKVARPFRDNIRHYIETNSFDVLSGKLVDIYRSCLKN